MTAQNKAAADAKALAEADVENRAVGSDGQLAKAQPLQPAEPEKVPSAMGATFAERKAARQEAGKQAENKSVR